MGKINIVRDDGTVVSVDESVVEHAHKTGISAGEESAQGGVERIRQRQREEQYGGVGGAVASAVSGGLDTLTLGGYGKAVGALGDALDVDTEQAYQDVAQEHPDARAAGEIGALLVPGLGELGAGARVGELATALGAGKTVARFAEGAAYGVGGAVAHSSASGDPLTVEGLVEGAGIGAVLNYGAGVLGDTLGGVGARAAARKSAGEVGDLLERESPAYQELVDARKGAIESARATNAVVSKEAAAWERYTASTNDFIRDRNAFDKVLNDVYAEATNKSGALPSRWSPEVDATDALDTMGRAAKEVNKADRLRNTDLEQAVEMLRPVRAELASKFDYALPELPVRPGTPVTVPDSLPKTLGEFSRLRPDTVADLSSQVASGYESQALQKLTNELGTIPGVTPGSTLADLHGTLSSHVKALDALGADGSGSLVKGLKWLAKQGVRQGAGGVGAAAGHVLGPVGSIAGYGIGKATGDAVITALATESKSGIRAKLQTVLSKLSTVGAGVKKLGPVTSYLSRSFPSGKKDKETDIGKLARNRVADLGAASVHVGNSAFAAVQPLNGHPSNLAPKIAQHVNNALQATLQAAPKDPGMTPRGRGSDWAPAPADAVALAYRLEALQKPTDAIARALGGEVHPAAIEALNAIWPATMQTLNEELAFSTSPDKLSPDRTNGLSALTGSPMSGLSVPANVIALQGMYLPPPQQPGQGSRGAGGGPNGRPPATGPSPVAGSNVNSLISQG